ncbi:MAG TPA: penicillin-binding protein [Candidatus Saccharimonadales bacterium]|nr:penicillin-binding protein [Candidatus Saccharimonadales bacterium]
MQTKKTHFRLLLIASLAFLWMTAVFGRLAYLQLYRHSEYLTRAQKQQQRSIEITPKRGVIYDRNMHALAMSIQVDSAYAVPTEIVDQQLAAKLLSNILEIPRDVMEAKLDTSRTFAWIARKLPPNKAEAIAALNLKGVYFQKENQRFYPKRELASHVIGYVNLDEKGLGGIEQEFESDIRGKNERILVMTDGRQRWFDGGEAQREKPADVVLTIDDKIQYIAERELAAAIEKTHALAGTVVVMNPNNGEVLAMANWPKYNPNAASKISEDMRTNRAVSTLYEPGSTFKLITLAAAFDQNLTRPEEVFNCENGAIYIAGHRIRDHLPFGLLNVSQILEKSSDVGAIKIALRLGPPKFYEYIRAFGFGTPTRIDLPGESSGLVRKLNNWTPVSIGSISMGQEVGVTPIQLTAAVSAIANGGMLYKPHVVAEMRRGDHVLPAVGPLAPTEPKRVIRPETAATMRRLMESVILNGTGKLAHLDGWTAAGKTGSAQKIDPNTGRYSPTQLIASFSGFAPINNPAVTILVSLDSPVGLHEGGMVAAPVFKRIAEQVLPYLDVPRDVPIRARLIEASYRRDAANDAPGLEDFTPADFSAQPDQLPAAAAEAQPHERAAPEVTMTVDEGGDIAVPDFSGKTMRQVTQMCLRLGLDPVLIGSSLATSQTPAPGVKLRRGGRVTVQFGFVTPKTQKSAKRR